MRVRLLALLAVLALLAGACANDDDDNGAAGGPDESPTTEAGEADPDGVLRVAYNLLKPGAGAQFSFDPKAAGSNVPDLGILHWIYGGLMRPTPDGTLVPDLAEEATVVDSTTVRAVLRDGVTLADGTPLTAQVAKTAIERNLEDEDLVAFNRAFFALETIDVEGTDTLVFNIPNGTAASWYDDFIAGAETLIVPEGVDFNRPAAAGPFRVTEFVPEQRIRLEKNPDYWATDEIRVGGIEVIHTPGAPETANALQADQIDFGRIEYATIDSVRGFDTLIRPDPDSLMQMYICKTDPPLDDVRVRQALMMAVDREAVSDALFDGTAAPAWDLWPEGHRFHNPDLSATYDLDQARELLADAGYSDGIEVGIIPVPSGRVPEMVEIVQQQWAEAGITLNIVPTSNFVEDYFQSRRAPLAGVPGNLRGRAKLGAWSGPALSNACGWQDAELDGLVADLAEVSDQSDEAIEIWHEIQEIGVGDGITIQVVFPPTVDAYDGDELGDVQIIPYALRVPDVRSTYVRA